MIILCSIVELLVDKPVELLVDKPGIVAHSCNSAQGRLTEKGCELKTRLNYTVRPCLR